MPRSTSGARPGHGPPGCCAGAARKTWAGGGLRPRGLVAALLAAAVSAAAAQVPKGVGPQGLLLWAEPRAVPELRIEDGAGRPLTLADFRGRVVLLNVWATWCPPCREEMPALDALQGELGGERFQVLALSIDRDGLAVVDAFYREIGIRHLRRYIDPSAAAGSRLGAPGIPVTLLLDRQGRELARRVGAAEWDAPEMVDFLTAIIEQSEDPGR